MKPYKIGIDLGGTNIKAGVVDADNHILVKLSCPTGAQRPWKEVADDIVRLALQALEQAGVSREDCAGVGMGCPGTVNAETGEVIYSNNFANWEYLPLGSYLTESLGMPVKMSNDANCAALGECAAGAAQGSASAVLLTLGTGVGGGVVWDGKVFEGGPGGMELGHTMLISEGEPCTCGRRGCVEAYCSATALIREAVRAARARPDSLLNTLCRGDLSQMDGKIPFDAAQAGDAAAGAVVERYLRHLGEAVVDMVNIFRPQVVLLSGGVCAQGEVLTAPLTEYVRRYAFASPHLAPPPVRIAMLGSDAGLIGAGCLVDCR